MRRIRIASGLVALALMAPAVEARHGGPCPGLLGTNVYRCTVKAEDGSSFTDCYRFSTAGQVSSKFEFSSDRLGATVGCACQPAGGKRVRFGAAAAFTCTSDLGVAFEGHVVKKGIANGIVTNAQGGSYAFACRIDGSCTPQ